MVSICKYIYGTLHFSINFGVKFLDSTIFAVYLVNNYRISIKITVIR